nr:MAG TPA: SECRETED 45 KDA PROTEIN CYCLE, PEPTIDOGLYCAN, CHAP, CELL [Caudoviricetes sp.]
MVKRLLLLLALLLPVFGYGTVSAAYTITAEQLTALEYNLNVLQTDNKTLTEQLKASNSDLTTARTALKESDNQIQALKWQLSESKREIIRLKESSNETAELLNKASESLNQLDKQDKAKNSRIKWLQIALAGTIVYAVTK